MELLHPCCAGLDVHKRTVEVTIRWLKGTDLRTETRQFGTLTRELLALSDWLSQAGVTHVAMESTGVYWKPIYNILEGLFQVLLVNAQHVKQVPGRKTDVADSQWLAQLLQHGLLCGSFVPSREIRDLRDLTRQRTQVVQEKTRVANRIHKTLEDANIKLASVASDILGASGRDMIQALIRGETDAGAMAELARRKLRGKIPQLQGALQGRMTEHHRFLLGVLWDHLEHLEGLEAQLDARIEEVMIPLESQVKRLDEIPGVDRRLAQVLLAEMGPDMSVFPTPRHLASWAGMCPPASGKRAAAGSRAGSRKRPGRPADARTAIWRRSTAAWSGAVERNGR